MYKNIVFLLLISLLISCASKDNVEADSTVIEKAGIFILNEGNYSVANSSLSYYYPDRSEIQNSIFYKVNNVPLGDVAQSLTIIENTVFVVINNSGLIYGINRNTLEFEGKINGLISPREMIFTDDNKAYISDLYSSSIVIVDPVLYEITGSIEIGKSSDHMIKSQNRIFIANWSAYNQTKLNNTIMVIDSDNDILVDSIIVGIEPNSMVIDKDGLLWVLCSGGFMNDEMPTLWQINPVSLDIVKTIEFGDILQNPDNLCINGTKDTLYFLNNGVFGMSIVSFELPENAIITSDNNTYYTLGIDPISSEIYISDAFDYNQDGLVYRYSAAGTIISSFEVGIIPGDFEFNY